MCQQSAPPPPDYTAAAKQTSAGNSQQAQIAQYGSMTNQVTPQGTVSYTPKVGGYLDANGNSITPDAYAAMDAAGQANYNPLNQWTQTVALSPEQQALYNQNQTLNTDLGNIASTGVKYVANAMANPLTQKIPLSSYVPTTSQNMTTNVDVPQLQMQVANAGPIQRGVANNADQISTNFDNNANQINSNFANNANQLQTSVANPTLLNQQVQDALYKNQTQYLDPQFQQSNENLQNRLANQGITQGSAAYDRAMLNAGNQQQQAYSNAQQNAITGGVSAANTLFGQNLAGGNFANTALGQQFGQGMAAQQAGNTALGQQFGQGMAAQQAGNTALGQQFGQNVTAGNFGNAAQGQQYSQNSNDMSMANAAAQGMFGMGQQNAALNNAVQNQAFAQATTNANLANAASGQQLSADQTVMNNPVNMLNAVRSSQQMQVAQQPQVGVSSPAALNQVAGPDYLGATNAQYTAQSNNVNAANAANAQMWGSVIGGAGALGGGFAAHSDIRLKKNIVKLGIHKTLGIGLYTWDYLWGQKGAGVMAQELEKVMPEAVFTMPDGFKAVNYSMLGA